MVGNLMADGIVLGTYTLQPYSATTQYVCAGDGFNSADGTAATYTTASGSTALWTIAKQGSNYTIKSSTRCLNAWDGGTSTSGDVKSNQYFGYSRWDIQPVSGKIDTYTIVWKGEGSLTNNNYLCYTSGDESSNLKYRQVTDSNPIGEDCYFVMKSQQLSYTAAITGPANVSAAKFTWTPSQTATGGSSLARNLSGIQTEQAQTVDYGNPIFTDGSVLASEFSLTGATATLGAYATPTIADDPANSNNKIVTFAFPTDYYINSGETATYSEITNITSTEYSIILNGGTLTLDEDLTAAPSSPVTAITASAASTLSISADKTYTQGIITGDGALTLAGAGTYKTEYSLASGKALGATLGTSWTGTVETTTQNIGGGVNFKTFVNGTSSSVKFCGTQGWISAASTSAANIVLENGTGDYTYGFMVNGANSDTYEMTGTVSGTGDFYYGQTESRSPSFIFGGDLSGWTGKFRTVNTGTTTMKITKAGTVGASIINESTGILNIDCSTVDGVTFANTINASALNTAATGKIGISGTPSISLTGITGATSLDITLDDATLTAIATKVGEGTSYTLIGCTGDISATTVTVNGASTVTLGDKTFNVMKTTSGIALMSFTGYTVSGTVTNSSSEAVTGAAITLTGQSTGIIYNTTSTATGYSISNVPNDTYAITATYSGLTTYYGSATVADADNTTANIQFTTGTIVGIFSEANPVFYRIKNVRGACYAAYNGDATNLKLTTDKVASTIFYFDNVTTEGLADGAQTVKMHNLLTSNILAEYNSFTTTGATTYIYPNGNTTYSGYAISSSYQSSSAWNDYQNSHTKVATYGYADDGSTWVFEQISPEEAYLEYASYLNDANSANYDILEGSVFGPTSALVSAYKTTLSELSTSVPYDCSKTWSANVTAISTALTTAKTTAETGWNTTFPTQGGKFIILNRCNNASRGHYLYDDTSRDGTSNLTEMRSSDTKGAAENIWEFIPTSTSGVYTMRNRGTGRFVLIPQSTSANTSLTTSLNRDNASKIIKVTAGGQNITGVTDFPAGYAVISNGDDISTTHSSLHFGSATRTQTWTANDSPASQWILYPVSDDILDNYDNVLIRNRNTRKFLSYDATAANIVQSDRSTGAVWSLSAGTDESRSDDYIFANYSLESNNKIRSNSGTTWTLDDTGTNLYVRTHPYGAPFNLISYQSGDPGYAMSSEGSSTTSTGVTTWYWYGASDYITSSWSIESLDRELEDATYELNKLVSPSEGHTSEYFYLTEEKYNTYNGYITAAASDFENFAAQYAAYKNIVDKLATGLVMSDYNIPADGYYYIKNLANSRYMGDDKIDEGSNGCVTYEVNTTDKPVSTDYYWYFKKTDDGYSMQNAKTKRYINTDFYYSVPMTETECSLKLLPAHSNFFGTAALEGQGTTTTPHYSHVLCGDENVTGWDSGTEKKSNWYFIPIETESAEELASALTKMDVACSDKLFYLSTEGKASLQTAYNNLDGDKGSYDYLVALKALQKDVSLYNLPTTGRYLIKNKATGYYLTSYAMLVHTTGYSYYSIWDVYKKGVKSSKVDDNDKIVDTWTEGSSESTWKEGGCYYNFQNEGNAFVMKPLSDGTTVDGVKKFTTGNGWMGYNESATSPYYYEMSETAADMVFEPTGDGYTKFRAKDDTYYAYDNGIGSSPFGRAVGTKDETLKTGDEANGFALWEFVPLNKAAEKESDMFYTQTFKNKSGYLGGPVTLYNVSSNEALDAINTKITTYTSTIGQESDNAIFAIGDNTNVGYYQEICQLMRNLSDDYRLSDKSVDGKKLFLENASRPSYKARALAIPTYDSDGTTLKSCVFRSTANVSDANTNAQWQLIQITSSDADNRAYAGKFYMYNVGTDVYLSREGSPVVQYTTDNAKKAIVYYQEVIPGMYLFYDVTRKENAANNSNKYYLTITGSGSGANYEMHYYSSKELSSHFKLYAYTELQVDPVTEMGGNIATTYPTGVDSEGNIIFSSTQATYTGFTSYCSSTNSATVIPTSGDYQIFYGANARYNTVTVGGSVTDGRLRVTLKTAPIIVDGSDTKYLLQGGVPFMVLTTTGSTFKPTATITKINKEVTSGGTADISESSVLTSKGLAITKDNWQDYYVLGYKSTSTVVGTWHAANVYGVGLGFYHPAVGTVITDQNALLEASKFNVADWSGYNPNTQDNPYSAREIFSSGVPCEIEFQDCDGNTTAIADVDAQGNIRMREDIYDLGGRKLSEPKSGINIINGKTVIVK